MKMTREEVEEVLKDNGELEDALADYIEEGKDEDKDAFYALTEKEQEEMVEEWHQEFLNTEWKKYVDEQFKNQ